MYCLTFELYSASAVWIFRLCINNILNRFDFITTIYTLYTRVIRSICYAKVPNMMNYKKNTVIESFILNFAIHVDLYILYIVPILVHVLSKQVHVNPYNLYNC